VEGHRWHFCDHDPSEGIGDRGIDARDVEFEALIGVVGDLNIEVVLELD
jgi:hypothetical protein